MYPVVAFEIATVARRWAVVAAVLFASYNPSGWSALHLVMDASATTALRMAAGVLGLTGVLVLARQAWLGWRLVGPRVTAVALLVSALLLWELRDWLSLGPGARYAISLGLLSLLLGTGHWLAILIRSLSGQTAILRKPP
jgi:hypothetical protein